MDEELKFGLFGEIPSQGVQDFFELCVIQACLMNIDTEHDLERNGSEVVESFIARKGDATFTPGAWVLGVHVVDPVLWGQIKTGEITGFSLFGEGERIARSEVCKSESSSAGAEPRRAQRVQKHSLDWMLQHAWRNRNGGGW